MLTDAYGWPSRSTIGFTQCQGPPLKPLSETIGASNALAKQISNRTDSSELLRIRTASVAFHTSGWTEQNKTRAFRLATDLHCKGRWKNVCQLQCFGYNRYGQCGMPDGLGVVVTVAAGGRHTCVVTATGQLQC